MRLVSVGRRPIVRCVWPRPALTNLVPRGGCRLRGRLRLWWRDPLRSELTDAILLGGDAMIHLRVVSPPDLTDVLVPPLQAERAVMNLTVLRSAVSNPTGTHCSSTASERGGRGHRTTARPRRGATRLDHAAGRRRGAVRACRRFLGASGSVPVRARLDGGRGQDPTRGSYPPSWFWSSVSRCSGPSGDEPPGAKRGRLRT